jgi:hypothetical protein
MTISAANARKLIVLCDGSSNSTARSDESNSTVIYKLNQAFANGGQGEQISFYFSGVGTRGDSFAAVTGEGINDIIADAYINLSSNYIEGDLIYIFGFSRGAVAARCLAGLISHVGLLLDSKLSKRFPEVWKAYEKFADPSAQQEADDLLTALSGDLHHPGIRFLGVFDSVPGDGYDKLKLMKVHPIKDLSLPKAVEHAVHLLSVDDNRIPSFQPLLWEGATDEDQTLEQIWMPGVHADVGGCSNGVFIGNLSVLTMIELLNSYCPEIQIDNLFVSRLEDKTFNRNAFGLQITNERSGFWRKLLPKKKRSAKGGINQTRHYLLQQIAGRRLLIRGKENQYCARHITSTVSGKHVTRYSPQIDAVVAQLGNQVPCCGHCN